MSETELSEIENDLHAYVDGALDDAGMDRVEAYLRAHPDAVAKVRGWLRQNKALHAAAQVAPVDHPAPEIDRLRRRLAARLLPHNRTVWPRVAAFAAVFAAGWFGHTVVVPLVSGPAYADEYAQAHLMTSAAPEEVLPLSNERVNRLFARIGESPRLPDLSSLGFVPVGAQLLPSDNGAVLHVAYRNDAGVTMSYFLFHTNEEDEVPVHVLHRKGVSLAYWQHDRSRYAIAASLTDDQIARIAEVIDSTSEKFPFPME